MCHDSETQIHFNQHQHYEVHSPFSPPKTLLFFTSTTSLPSAHAVEEGEPEPTHGQQRLRRLKQKYCNYTATISNPLNPDVCDSATVCGTVTFALSTNQIHTLIQYNITGLTPGLHGMHIHEAPVTPNCTSAGGHWNPKMVNHGSNLDMQRHVGDLGNVLADASGNAMGSLLACVPFYTSYGLAYNSLAVVIHAATDDLGRGGNDDSRAVGNAGARPGCGNVTRAC